MSEALQLRDPLFKLIIRFSNGESTHYISTEPIQPGMLTPDTRYAVIGCYSVLKPSEMTDLIVVNMRDVTFIKTERVTLDDLSKERRPGIRSGGPEGDDRLPKTLAQLKFI